MPKDDDPSWLTTLNTMSTAASLSTNMPKGGWYNITSKAAVAGDGTWNMLQSSNGKALAQMGLSGTALDDVGASGILELTVGAVTAHTGGTTGSVALTGKFWGTKKDGTALNGAALDAITALANGALESELKTGATKLGKLKLDGLAKITADNFKSGDKIYIAVGANRAANDVVMKMDGRDENGNKLFTNYTPEVVVTPAADQNVNFVTPFSSDGKDIDFTKAKFDASDLGTASVTLNSAAFLGANAAAIAANLNNKTLASFNWGVDKLAKISSTIGEVASSKTKLADLEKFWDAQGRFMITDPQTITITQGDGRQAKVTLYKDDTLGSMAEKLNNAIAKTLNQGQYVDDMSKFVTFVNKETDEDTPESAKGTLVIRTVVPGATGRINFAGDEDVIKALSLNTIQDAKETNYTVNITDAHTGATVLEDTKITGNRLIGALHPNVDVEFDAMAGITAEWDKTKKVFTSKTIDYETVLHLADNTTVFQIGANEGEDMGINIGDMRSHALGLNEVLVTDRASAARSITIIDNAIDKVSTQRAKLGAYQNRLEHTINNLTVAGENLTAAESRIRDTDMAKEMMNFTKLQIMLQAGTSMLAQANQLPQTVMTLIR